MVPENRTTCMIIFDSLNRGYVREEKQPGDQEDSHRQFSRDDRAVGRGYQPHPDND